MQAKTQISGSKVFFICEFRLISSLNGGFWVAQGDICEMTDSDKSGWCGLFLEILDKTNNFIVICSVESLVKCSSGMLTAIFP